MPFLAGVVLLVEVAVGPVYNEAVSYPPLVVDVPAGSIAPGRAEARIEDRFAARVDHRVTFEMPEGRGARIRLWRDPLAADPASRELKTVVTPSKGPPVIGSIRVDSAPRTVQGDVLFAGTPRELDAFSAAVRGHALAADADSMLGGIRVVDRAALAPRECRSLVEAALVVAPVERWEPEGRELFECAVRGANVVFVGPPPPPLDGLSPGKAWFFGLGMAASASDFDAMAASAALDIQVAEKQPYSQGFTQQRQNVFRSAHQVVGSRSAPIPGRGAILGVLVAYVALIGPVGWFVARRRRTTWVLWAWFPCVSLGAVLLFFIVGSTSHLEVARLTVSRLSFEGPGYGGLADVAVSVSGRNAESYRVSLPFVDGDIENVARAYRFGSPFRRPAGNIELLEDMTKGRIAISGLAVDNYGVASLSFVSPVPPRPAPRVELLSTGGVRVTNPTDVALARTVVVMRSGWADVGRLAPSESRRVNLSSTAPIPDPSHWGDGDHRYSVLVSMTRDTMPPGTWLIACNAESPKRDGAHSDPALPVRLEDVRIVVGPLREAQ